MVMIKVMSYAATDHGSSGLAQFGQASLDGSGTMKNAI